MTRLKRETDLLYKAEWLFTAWRAPLPYFFFFVEMPLSGPDGTRSLAGFHRRVLFIRVFKPFQRAGSMWTDVGSRGPERP